jgi:hypothetical protein
VLLRWLIGWQGVADGTGRRITTLQFEINNIIIGIHAIIVNVF